MSAGFFAWNTLRRTIGGLGPGSFGSSRGSSSSTISSGWGEASAGAGVVGGVGTSVVSASVGGSTSVGFATSGASDTSTAVSGSVTIGAGPVASAAGRKPAGPPPTGNVGPQQLQHHPAPG